MRVETFVSVFVNLTFFTLFLTGGTLAFNILFP